MRKTTILIFAAGLSAAAIAAVAAGSNAPHSAADAAAPTDGALEASAGPSLDSICNACGVVTASRSEQRKVNVPVNTAPAAVGGAVTGAVIGRAVGNGKPLPTIAGAVVGGMTASEAARRASSEPRTVIVWTTHVTFKDGTRRTFEAETDPGWKAGDVVRVMNGQLFRHR